MAELSQQWYDAEMRWVALQRDKGSRDTETVLARVYADSLQAKMTHNVLGVAVELLQKTKGGR